MATFNAINARDFQLQLANLHNAESLMLFIDPDHGLAAGANPFTPSLRFDFAKEQFVAVENTPQKDEMQKVSEVRIGRATGKHSVSMNGVTHWYDSQKQLLIGTLLEFESLDDGFMEKVASLKSSSGIRLVARNQIELHPQEHLTELSEKLENGWWIFTNNSRAQAETWIRKMARVSRHEWADRLKIIW